MQENFSNDTVILSTYRYIWKDKKTGNLCVKFITETLKGHEDFMNAIRNDDNVVSCCREYMHEINFAYLGFTDSVKVEKKEEDKQGVKEDEKV